MQKSHRCAFGAAEDKCGDMTTMNELKLEFEKPILELQKKIEELEADV